MPAVSLKIEDLLLDQSNPRNTTSSSPREALQKIVTDQGVKLAELAESIVDQEALNPMERMLVLKHGDDPTRYVVLEGNRRTAALKILINPAVLGSLEVAQSVRRRLEAAAAKFKRDWVEPITAFALDDREDAEYWLRLRHTGENEGRGVVNWSTQQQDRFVGASPSLQAVDFVKEHGRLTDDEKHKLGGRFTTTVKRLLDSPGVRQLIGVEVRGDRLLTGLPADEVIKPLKRIVLDLALGRKRVTDLKLVDQMIAYVESFEAEDLPDLSTLGDLIEVAEVATLRPTVELDPGEGPGGGRNGTGSTRGSTGGGNGNWGGPGAGSGGARSGSGASSGNDSRGAANLEVAGSRRGVPDPSKRDCLVPKNMKLRVSDSRIAAIHKELKVLKLKDTPNAIAVLLRVFIELSVDHYMTANGMDHQYSKSGKKYFKSFQDKVGEVLQYMVDHQGADAKVFVPLKSAIHDQKSPLHFELLHSYVHNQYSAPDVDKLKAAWDQVTPLLLKVWP